MEQFKQEIENTFNYLERIDYRLLTHKCIMLQQYTYMVLDVHR